MFYRKSIEESVIDVTVHLKITKEHSTPHGFAQTALREKKESDRSQNSGDTKRFKIITLTKPILKESAGHHISARQYVLGEDEPMDAIIAMY